jgi:ribosome-binding factor A
LGRALSNYFSSFELSPAISAGRCSLFRKWKRFVKTRKQRFEAALLCDALGADDGVDTRSQRKMKQQFRRTYHQDQLARQVERALNLALSTSSDPILQDLAIFAISTIGNSLRIVVTPLSNRNTPTEAEINMALVRASGRLRTLVGEAITRKRVPELLFSVYCGSEVQHE